MPTGYTSKLYDGEQSFEDFVWGCARGFGALVMLRDDMDAPITDEALVTNYYERRVGQCEHELAEWNACTPEACRSLYDSWLATESTRRTKDEETRVARKARYLATLEKVKAWKPPSSDHENLRATMIEQLNTSIDFDCSVYDSGPLPDFATWSEEHVARILRSLAYAHEERAKERARNEQRIQWVRLLQESVPMPPNRDGAR